MGWLWRSPGHLLHTSVSKVAGFLPAIRCPTSSPLLSAISTAPFAFPVTSLIVRQRPRGESLDVWATNANAGTIRVATSPIARTGAFAVRCDRPLESVHMI